MLIFTRAFMGVGAALIMPATLSLLTNIFTDPKERARAIGIWAAVAGAGGALGPCIGGFLLEHFWWGSVFLVNVPVVDRRHRRRRTSCCPTSRDADAPRLDPLGAVLSIVGLVAVLWAIIEAPPRAGATPTVARRPSASASSLLAGFVVWELHYRPPDARRPLLPEPPLHRRQRRHHARVLRHVRLDVPRSPSTCSSCSASTPLEAGIRDAADGRC